jgi:hypothetical protein
MVVLLVKMSLSLIKDHARRTWVVSSTHVTPKERAAVALWIGRQAGLKAGMEAKGKSKIPYFCRESNLNSSAVQLAALSLHQSS